MMLSLIAAAKKLMFIMYVELVINTGRSIKSSESLQGYRNKHKRSGSFIQLMFKEFSITQVHALPALHFLKKKSELFFCLIYVYSIHYPSSKDSV